MLISIMLTQAQSKVVHFNSIKECNDCERAKTDITFEFFPDKIVTNDGYYEKKYSIIDSEVGKTSSGKNKMITARVSTWEKAEKSSLTYNSFSHNIGETRYGKIYVIYKDEKEIYKIYVEIEYPHDYIPDQIKTEVKIYEQYKFKTNVQR